MKTKKLQIVGGFPQSDWKQSNEAAVDYIKNKPDIDSLRPLSMISFIDDDCRVQTHTMLFPLIQELEIPITLACPPGNLADDNGVYMSWSDLQSMHSDHLVTISCHHNIQTNMNMYESVEAYAADLDSCLATYESHGITGVNTICYPQGVYVDEFIEPVKERFKMGFGVFRGINQIPYESYFMKRCELFPTNGKYTIDDAKALVNEVAVSGGWLIFMTHAWYDTFSVDEFKSLISHIRDKNVEIVSVDEAIERTGNKVEVGLFKKPMEDLTEPYFVTDALGRTYSNKYTPMELSMRSGKIISTSGPVISTSDKEYTVSEKYNVSGNTSILVSGWSCDGLGLYVFYDDAGNRKEVKYSTASYANGGDYLINQQISVPAGATQIAIAGHFRHQMPGLKVVKEYLSDKPTYTASEVGALPATTEIPSTLADLSEDATHRTITDSERSNWNAKVDASSLTSAVEDALTQAKESGEFNGESGVYVGSGDMPEGYNVQIDLSGEADIEILTADETKAIIAEEMAKKTQLKPEFANSIEDCTDTSKLYVLPDGYIYAYVKRTEAIAKPTYTNLYDKSQVTLNQRYSLSSGNFAATDGAFATGWVELPANPAENEVYLYTKGLNLVSNDYGFLVVSNNKDVSGDADRGTRYSQLNYIGGSYSMLGEVLDASTYYYKVRVAHSADGTAFACASDVTHICLIYQVKTSPITANDLPDFIMAFEPIENQITTETVEGWASTGHRFVPADYEDRIIETYEQSLKRIKEWKYPIHEDAPVFLLEENKPAIDSSEQNTEAVYAKYDALMNANSHYITREEYTEKASDGTTPLYVYHFKEPEPHYPSPIWSETKPVILVCSGVHPTEQTGVHCLYHAMEEITTNPKLRDLRRNVHFIIMPMINPTGFTDSTYGVRNPDGIQVHYNFEVDFKYPTDSGYVEHGNRNHGGETPLSIPETRYFDSLMQQYKDNLAIVVSCHNNDVDTRRGTDVVWCSCATHYMCNLGFRFADKMSAAWREKYGTAFDEGLAWANEYALTKAASGSSIFNATYIQERPEWDYRVGMASLSGSGGTEYKQALKYGVHGINVEACDRCLILDRDFSKTRTENVVTMGTETYINFFRTFMAVYDPKNKKDYAPNLPRN